MIREGKPSFLPWSSDDMTTAARRICKPLFGNAAQRASTTFIKSIRACPGCAFAALDVRSGFTIATSDVSLRDAALALLGEADGRTAYYFNVVATDNPKRPKWVGEYMSAFHKTYFGPLFGAVWTDGSYINDMAVNSANLWWSGGQAWSHLMPQPLSEQVNQFLARDYGYEPQTGGFILYFGGAQGDSLTLPTEDGAHAAVAFPVLAVYGVWHPWQHDPRPALAEFGARLLTFRAAEGESLLAVVADKLTFVAETAATSTWGTDIAGQAWYPLWEASNYRAWLDSLDPETWFESGKVPPWFDDDAIAGGTLPDTPALYRWTDEDGEPVTEQSAVSADNVTVALDNL